MSYELEEIDLKHENAFLAMLDDYASYDEPTKNALYPGEWSPMTFKKFVRECEKNRMDWRPKAGKTSITRYVLVDEEGSVCGNGILRFPLSATADGNLLFDVPPSRRREGFGALVLNRLLFEAVRAGLARVSVVCDPFNVGAIACIEKNRGVREAPGRYWISFR